MATPHRLRAATRATFATFAFLAVAATAHAAGGARAGDGEARHVSRAHARPRGGPAPVSGPFLSTGFASPAWLVLRLAGFARRPGTDAPQVVLAREEGRRVCTLPVRDAGCGLYLRVKGRVQFERLAIGFGDGREQEVDAFGLERGDGTFELAGFGENRDVAWVRLVLRARSPGPGCAYCSVAERVPWRSTAGRCSLRATNHRERSPASRPRATPRHLPAFAFGGSGHEVGRPAGRLGTGRPTAAAA